MFVTQLALVFNQFICTFRISVWVHVVFFVAYTAAFYIATANMLQWFLLTSRAVLEACELLAIIAVDFQAHDMLRNSEIAETYVGSELVFCSSCRRSNIRRVMRGRIHHLRNLECECCCGLTGCGHWNTLVHKSPIDQCCLLQCCWCKCCQGLYTKPISAQCSICCCWTKCWRWLCDVLYRCMTCFGAGYVQHCKRFCGEICCADCQLPKDKIDRLTADISNKTQQVYLSTTDPSQV